MSDSNEETNVSYEQRINEAVNNLQQDESGKWVIPEDLDEATRFAVNAERRRRDTQSAWTKTQAELARTKAENNHLVEGWSADFTAALDPVVQAELAELKVTDPDAWRNKLNELEAQRKAKFAEVRNDISTKSRNETELEYRERALQEFAAAHPDFALTDEVIKNDLPPRFLKELEDGKVSFGQFLDNAYGYLSKGKVLKPQEEVPSDKVNLSKATGSPDPSEDAVRQQLSNSYNEEIY